MNVFVLCTGRCGSVTFIEACKHMSNYSAAHESRTYMTGNTRFAYPNNHIEADNRLSWLLGRLDRMYGDSAFYVHLQRNTLDTARSFLKRWDGGIMKAYRSEILMGAELRNSTVDRLDICVDYCNTVNSNIDCFLRDKKRKMNFYLERCESDFSDFFTRVGAEGDFTAGLSELKKRYNASMDA